MSAASPQEIDRLVRAGELALAADHLEARLGPDATVPQWLQLAGLRRAAGQPARALEAVHRALALQPLDFMALTMRAGLLERIGDPAAGQAWGEALAQRPPGELPAPLAAAIAAGEAVHARWLDERAARLDAGAEAALADAGEDTRWKARRFRETILRRERVWHSQPTHFHYPGLVEREFHPRATTPWLDPIERSFPAIRAEMEQLVASRRAELVPYIQYDARESLGQWAALNRNPDWSAIHLLRQGERVEANAAQCPRTMALLEAVPQPQVPGASPNAMFSLLAPRTAIPAHVGVDNTRLVCHLPLVVPEGCWFRVGGETRVWREGTAFAFDDTIEHEAANPSDSLRVVFIFDAWHPGLSPIEREVVAGMIGSERQQPGRS